MLSETWLTHAFKTEEFFPHEYTVFRQDRYSNNENANLRGGGLITAVKSNLVSELILSTTSPVQMLSIRVKCGNDSWIYIVNIYITCNSSEEVYRNFIKSIYDDLMPLVKDGCHVVFIGDFNLPRLEWQ